MRKAASPPRSVVFVLDHLFGAPRLGAKDQEIFGMDFMPGAGEALEEFATAGSSITVATGSLPKSALQMLKHFLPPVEHVASFRRTLGPLAAGLRKREGNDVLFVAADRVRRGQAARFGWKTAPGPAIATLILRSGAPIFVRAVGPANAFRKLDDMVPYAFERQPGGDWWLLAAMSRATLAEIVRRKLPAQVLPLNFSSEDPLLVQLDDLDKEGAEEITRQKVLFAEGTSVLLALPPEQFTDMLALHGRHGHYRLLMPNPGLLVPPTPAHFSEEFALSLLGRWPIEQLEINPELPKLDLSSLVCLRCPGSAASFQADVDRYRGAIPLDAAGPIISRHERHADNSRAVDALLADLRAIGYCAYSHAFTHGGRTLHNVIADLPGRGVFRVAPDLREILREAILKHPIPDPRDPWIEALEPYLGRKWRPLSLRRLNALVLRGHLERLVGLPAWERWWFCLQPLAGPGTQIVILGCHMDSVAGRSEIGYDPLTDAAPGADDNASGMAATLALARHFWQCGRNLRHTVRFCFFNAEESGLVGSRAYAAAMKAARAPIKAVICTDMISFNRDNNRTFEVHAGASDPAVRDLSAPIAEHIEAAAAALGTLGPAQIYRGTNPGGGADRLVFDGAIGRSDHASFQEQGYPAVVVSEDFFVNLPGEPSADANPNYHRSTDTVIDPAYGADITCVLARVTAELAA